jgi:2,3-bisphosphoglycerate-dependent phosphoglycerate mutase
MQEPTRLVLVRHGETDWNGAGRIQGHTDVELNARGHWQAERAALALADQGLDAIVTSDLRRAHATAEAIARRAGLPLAVEPGLRERSFGILEGQTFAEIQAARPHEAQRWQERDPDHQPLGGESLRQFHARARAAALRWAAQHAGRHLAVVAHGGVLDALYRAAADLPPEAPRHWAIDNASIHRFLVTDGRLVMLHWGDVSHLADHAGHAGHARDDPGLEPPAGAAAAQG